jgi:hypothetical protein
MRLEAFDSYREVGYFAATTFIRSETAICTPVGVVYGNSNEVLGGLSWHRAEQAQISFDKVQSAQSSRSNAWVEVVPEALSEANVTSAFGQTNAFIELGTKRWDGWDVVFRAGPEEDNVVVLRKSETAD